MSSVSSADIQPGSAQDELGALLQTAPQVSIVVPAYNCERFLQETAGSIRAQTFGDWELIIVDDGATDGAGALADRLADEDGRIRVIHQENSGPAHARNSGAAVSNSASPYVTFLDGDDLWLPDTLETLVGALDEHPEWAGVHGLGAYMDDSGRAILPGELERWCGTRLQLSDDLSRRILNPADAPTTFEMLALRNYMATGTILLRKDEFEREGGFDERVKSVEDWHLWVRITLHRPIGYVDKVVFRYRRHTSNMSSNRLKMQWWQYKTAKDLYESAPMTAKQRALFLRSQPIVCHLLWAAHDMSQGFLSGTVRHVGIAVRNLIDYHIVPRLRRT